MIHFLRGASAESLKGRVLLRLDFNTEDEWRLKSALPTIRFLLRYAEKIVIVSHKGRPIGFDKKFSLRASAKFLEKLLKRKIIFFPHFRFEKIKKTIAASPRGSIFLLENLRFLKGEWKNDLKFAKKLASLADYYVNEAFAVCHRANASVSAITRFLKSYAGLELENELKNLSKVMKNPQKPLTIVLGGAKAEDRLGIVKFLKNKVDWFLLGGAPANTLFLAEGIDIKDSVALRRHPEKVRPFLKYPNIVLPIDFVFSGRKILDASPKTVQVFKEKISQAKTIVWNGPFGVIEKKRFEKGTLEIGKAIARNRRAFSVAGGGETVMFLKKYGLDKKFSFISTGGGAMLDFLSGRKLPGIAALERRGGKKSK
ncbi:MAG: phosphoglycerate kinase [Candidatus Liptonbacteria bacterium]|nr:phosphoglycerate kinase [Candidatus Liptonbacteria bacterium]